MKTRRKIKLCAYSLLVIVMALFCAGCPGEDTAPDLWTATPDHGLQGGPPVEITLTGTHLQTSNPRDQTFVLMDGDTTTDFDVVVHSVTTESISLTLTVHATASPGAHAITVQTGAGISDPKIFTVECNGCPGPPRLLNLITIPENTPLIAGGAQVPFQLIGINFLGGDPDSLLLLFDDSYITYHTSQVYRSGDFDYFDVVITASSYLSPGFHSVTVQNDAGKSNLRQFTVYASNPIPVPPPGPAPYLGHISPNPVCKCDEFVNIKFEGSGFGTQPDVVFDNPRIGVLSGSQVYQEIQDQVAVFTITVPSDIADSFVTVHMVNHDNNTISESQFLNLENPRFGTPLVTNADTFDELRPNGYADYTIRGQNLEIPPEGLLFTGVTGLMFGSVSQGPGYITVRISADGTTQVTGDQATNLTITNGVGQGNAFAIRVLPPESTPTPNLTRVTPDHFTKGGATVTLKCEGYNFGQRRSVFSTCCFGNHNTPTVLANRDQVVVTFFDPPDNLGSSLTIQVENEETGLASNGKPISLDDRVPGIPFVAYVSNDTIRPGEEANATIGGENLDGTTDDSFSGIHGLHFSQTVVVSSNRVTVHVQADPDTPITGDDATNLIINIPGVGDSNAFAFWIDPP